MPASPSAAQSAASRLNGAASAGPATPEGKARSALNGTRHNLHGPFRLLAGEDEAAFEALRADLRGRHAPAGEAEAHWCDELARAYWRQRRLFALEEAALTAPLAEAIEGTDRLPSLATLARYRVRVERDARLAREQLDALKASRPTAPAAARLRWLLARAEEQAAVVTAAPEAAGTPEPEPAAAPLAPEAADTRPLNRHERRRLTALRRHGRVPTAALGPQAPGGI
jgi:hypothetical protein